MGRFEIEENRWLLLFLILAPICGVLINGYRFGVSDQALYIPMIDRAIDGELFSHDYLFGEPSPPCRLAAAIGFRF